MMHENRGPHKRIAVYLMNNGQASRRELRMSFAYDYSGHVVQRTLDGMISKGLVTESEGLIRLNGEIVK